MIKRLQLRGISRNPSDRYTADGGCAESLNVFLDNDETAPALKPVVVNTMTDDRGVAMFPYPDWGHGWEAVFIHKTPTFKRAIIKYTDNNATKLGTWGLRAVPSGWVGTGCTPFMTLASGEEFIRCINLGNSLGIVTTQGTKWVLMKEGEYSMLGASIPFPGFTMGNYEVIASEDVTREKHISRSPSSETAPTRNGGVSRDSLAWILEEIDMVLADNRKAGVYNRQQLAILAVRLFDGSRIISAPVLIAPGFDNPFELDYSWEHISGGRQVESATINLRTAYKLFLKIDEDSDFYEGWEDVVDSFEVYLSQQIDVDRTRSYFTTFSASETDGEVTSAEGTLYVGKSGSPLQSYLDASNFYRVYSEAINADLMTSLRQGVLLDTSDYMSTDDLVTRGIRLDTLSDMNHYETNFTRAILYNNKVVATGVSEEIRLNLALPIAKNYRNPDLSDVFIPEHTYEYTDGEVLAFRMTFHLRDDKGNSISVKAMNKDSDYFTFGNETFTGTHLRNLKSDGYGMIFCPDVRAYAVDIQAFYGALSSIEAGTVTPIGGATLSLTAHPYLNCSYWYGDITEEMVSYCSQSGTYVAGDESYTDNRPNKVYMSEMDNPFVFPVSSRYTLNSRVLGCAIATAALSEGQFGQFPVYVFTEDGIWAMESAADGTIVSTKPMSREVCSNPDSITSIDNAVVFMTEKSVMLVSGSQITDLSPYMNGRHYAMGADSSEARLIGGGQWSEYLPTLLDTTHFMAFMESAVPAYDYKGGRLVFVNESKSYQYVYMLKTNTWHKLYVDGFGSGLRLSRVMNAYPDTYVNAVSGDRYVWDLSSRLDVTSLTSIQGVVITRPFDLGSPDVRKSVNDIRIRGAFNRRDARYILLGSMDGINWGVMPSLRGGSYKWFRLIILTSLSPTERISWIDIDYDTRLTNKLR